MKRWLTFLFILLGAGFFVFAKPAQDRGAANATITQVELEALDKTTVYRDDQSPTGYYVTFRYKDPNATRVRVKGEWTFTDLAHASLTTSLNAGPENWQDGYVVYSTGEYWRYSDAILNKVTGVWSYTIPLPAGRWSYAFVIGGVAGAAANDLTGATQVYDPHNPPIHNGEPARIEESSVYVPIVAEKQQKTAAYFGDWSEQAPRNSQNGQVFYVNLPNGSEVIPYGMYLPYDFDKNRVKAYPIMVLYHGGGGTEANWFNAGGITHVLDNLIAEGRLEPTIVVTPTTVLVDGRTTWDRPDILNNVTTKILPYMVRNYNASTDPKCRAFAGLSMGGATTAYAMFHNTDDFGYFGLFSAPLTADVAPDYTIPALKEKGIFFGFGWWDMVCYRSLYSLFPDAEGKLVHVAASTPEGSIFEYLINLAKNDIPFTNLYLPSGHIWDMWRRSAAYFMENVLWK